jgi:hypothetical protein
MPPIVQQTGIRVGINTQNRTNIRTVALGGQATIRLRDLTDVNATSLTDGYVIVYDIATDKFVVKQITAVDGGSF